MKHFITIVIVGLIAILFCSCQTDTNLYYQDDSTSITISLDSPRISLDPKKGEIYPMRWNEGDRIVVNGNQSQEAEIDPTNEQRALFQFNETLQYPYNITYPYTSTTSAKTPKVVVPTVQQYTEGTFAPESVPMCGYVTSKNEKIVLKNLVGLLKFSLVGNNTILDRVVITSTDGVKLSGEFEVNCNAGTMKACQNSTNSITYTLPDNFTLSTTKESTFFISIPAGDTGNCTIEFFDALGGKMTSSWSNKTIKAGIVREFKTIQYKQGINNSLAPLESEEDSLIIFYPIVEGYVKDSNGTAISGVAVSDGFSVVKTNSKGYYKIENVSKDSHFIYISIPSEYEVPVNEYGQPCFYKSYPEGGNKYNFTLTPLANGKEEKFALFTFADPQVSKDSTYGRLMNEAIPEILKHSNELTASGINCYGITLGDIVSNSDSSNSGAYRDDMRDAFAASKTGMPVFQVMGNHDNTFCNETKPLFTDERNSHFELKAQREHEAVFGPANYSFNRGNVHIVGMRDIVYRYSTSSSNYATGFLPSQYEWLKQDLALVPKDHMVVLCVHIQLFNGTGNYIQEVLSLLDQFKESHVLSGHTHRQQLYEHTTKSDSKHKVYEHNTCAVCGAWWSANIAGDGTPNGYNVFIGEGSTFSDWYYMGYNKGMNTRSHQMRLYRGDAITGGPIEGANTYGVKGYYQFNFADNVLLANVYNADSQWTIDVYEDGAYSGKMTQLPATHPKFSALVGKYSYEDPRRAADGVETGTDFYVTGLALGILNRYSTSKNGPGNGAYDTCWHMYKYSLKNKNAQIKVVATDRFGNKYTEEKITEGTDYTLAKKPQ